MGATVRAQTGSRLTSQELPRAHRLHAARGPHRAGHRLHRHRPAPHPQSGRLLAHAHRIQPRHLGNIVAGRASQPDWSARRSTARVYLDLISCCTVRSCASGFARLPCCRPSLSGASAASASESLLATTQVWRSAALLAVAGAYILLACPRSGGQRHPLATTSASVRRRAARARTRLPRQARATSTNPGRACTRRGHAMATPAPVRGPADAIRSRRPASAMRSRLYVSRSARIRITGCHCSPATRRSRA